MKKVFMMLVMVALLALSLAPATSSVSAQKFPGYVSGIQVQNLSGSTATVSLNYYFADDGTPTGGTLADTAGDTIAGNSSKTYFPTLTSFTGSMVVESSTPVAAVSNLNNSAGTAGASYVGSAEGYTSISLPLLMKNNGSEPYDTWFSVQNAGDANANVSIQYSDCASPVTATIKPNAAKTFSQATEACHTSKVFSATITSGEPLVVVVLEENILKMLAYTGFASGSNSLVMPLINTNNSGITTGVQIQNTGASDTTVTLTYSPSLAGTECTETQTIPAHGSKTFALVAFSGNNSSVDTTCVELQKFVGSATVTSNSASMPLVGIVNQTKALYGGAYGAFNPDPAKVTPKVVMPLLMDRNGRNVYSTGFSVMNVGGASTYVKCTLTGTSKTYEQEIGPGEAMTPNMAGQIAVGYVGSGTCVAYQGDHTTVDTSARIVAIVNELGLTTADRLLVYEGINVAP